MKRNLRILFITLLFHGFASAQNKIYVPILPNECLNCVNLLGKLNEIDTALPISLVFPKRYKSDSAALSKRLFLEDYNADIIWSDSLFNQLKNKKGIASAVSVLNLESRKSIKVPLSRIEEGIPFFNSLTKTDTINLSSSAFGGETVFKNSGSFFYIFNTTSKEVKAFDKIDGQHLYTIAMTDSLIRAAFKLRYPVNTWKKEYEEVKALDAKRKRIDANAIDNIYCSNDTVYVKSHHNYIYRDSQLVNPETMIFLTYAVYKSGQLIDFSIIENYMGPEFTGMKHGVHRVTSSGASVKHEGAYFLPTGETIFYNGELYIELLGGYSEGIPNYFLGIFKKKARNIYEFDRFYKGTLPENAYKEVGYNYVFASSGIPTGSSYMSLFLSDHLFSLDPIKPDLKLNFLSNRFIQGKGIYDIRVGQEYAYLIFGNGEDKKIRGAKIEIKTSKVIKNIALCDPEKEYISNCSIDDFDFNFIYIPIGEQTILRKSILE